MSVAATVQPTSSVLSAEEVHAQALAANSVTNRGRLTLIQLLRIIKEGRLHHELGFPSIAAYADRHFGYRKTLTYESIRVAQALDHLPRCLEAFGEGRLGWSGLREITRVAGSETEAQWLDFAARHTVARLVAEVDRALAKKRDAPRKEGFGLPALTKVLKLRLSPSEYEKVRLLLRRVSDHAAEKIGGKPLTAEQALVLLAEHLLGDGGDFQERLSRGRPLENVLVYQTCPGCRRGGVHTPEGLVEVEREEIERMEGNAVVEQLDAAPPVDRPTPARMARQIHLREGQRCSNPLCSSPSDHCHHIVFRSQQGATVPENLVAVCGTCHALVHQGLLKVSGVAGQELVWESRSEGLGAQLAESRIAADELPLFRIESARVNSAGISSQQEDALSALRNLGLNQREARARVEAGLQRLGSGPHDLAELIRASLAAGRMGRPG